MALGNHDPTNGTAALDSDLTLEADVAIIGSGAGGGTTAEILSAAGYKVLLIEEGPLKTSSDFKLLEDEAYTSLYQEGIGRMSKDGAITILQGRAVGGTTLINWTSSFRTPDATLSHWASEYAVKGHSSAEMAPWFEKMEQRLGIAPWAMPPNPNNDVIRKGCEKLGYSWHVIPRNVRGCFNLGYCGMGCPVNAKQSMLVTTIPSTLEAGGELLYLARAERLKYSGDTISSLECVAIGALRKVKVYEAFVEGAKEGFDVAKNLLPYLVAMLCAVGVLRASRHMPPPMTCPRPACRRPSTAPKPRPN